MRRDDGIESRSLARALSAHQEFLPLSRTRGSALDRSAQCHPHAQGQGSLPKALTVLEAKATIATTAEMEDRPWVAARDMAVLSLCYGAGLRISEALALSRADLDGPTLRVTGKGGKTRMVPLIDAVRASVETYLGLCPSSSTPTQPLFRGIKGGVLSPRLIQMRVVQLRSALGLPPSATPHALRHSFATHLLGPRRRPARHPGTARPRVALDDADLHCRRHRPPARELPRCPSARLTSTRGRAYPPFMTTRTTIAKLITGLPLGTGVRVF